MDKFKLPKIKKSQLFLHLIGFLVLVLVAILANFFLQASVQSDGFSLATAFEYFKVQRYIFVISTLFILLVGFLFSLLFGSFYTGAVMTAILFFGFSYANNLKMISRHEPIYPNELGMIRNIKELMSMIDAKMVIIILIAMLLTEILIVFINRLVKHKLHIPRQGWKSYLTRGILLVPVLFLLSQFYFLGSKPTFVARQLEPRGIENLAFNQTQNYQKNSFVLGFLMNTTYKKPAEPEGYSEQAIKKIVEKYNKRAVTTNKKAQKLPKHININLILSESLTDLNYPDIQEYITFNQNPQPFMTSLKNDKNAIVKTMVSDQYGGGTANVEFEVLTGMTNYFISENISPYQNIIPQFRSYPSAARTFEQDGLKTTALHSYNANMYKRSSNYPKLGIEKFITIDQMKNLALNPYGAYTTDQSLYDYLYKTWTKNKNNQAGQFNFTLTMQNHMPYRDSWDASVMEQAKNKPIRAKTTAKFSEEKIKGFDLNPLNNYANSAKLTDDALKDLYDKVMAQKEPSMVILFGDHRPGGIIDFLRNKNPIAGYSTPVIYFANFPLQSSGPDTISPNTVMPNIYNQADLKRSGWNEFLLDLQEQIPVLNHKVITDKSGKIINPETAKKLKIYQDYQLLNYDQNFGEQYARKYKFFNLKN